MPTRDLTKFPGDFNLPSQRPMITRSPANSTHRTQRRNPPPEPNAGIHGLTQTPALHDALSSGARGFARGGSESITNMLTSASHACAGVMRTKLQVIETPVRNGKSTNLVPKDGEEIRATRVISNIQAKLTFLKAVQVADFPAYSKAFVKKFKTPGTSAKRNTARDHDGAAAILPLRFCRTPDRHGG